MKYAVIQDNKIVNVIVWDGKCDIGIPSDSLIQHDDVEMDWIIVDGTLTPPPIPEPSYDELAVAIRNYRNRLLSESDWSMLPDAPVNHDAWVAYRQALRDITDQPTFPYTVTWPSVPE